jgi:putative lipoprotein (rSAM/lipoprotein system)
MKKVKKSFFSTFNVLISFLVSVLGFASCSDIIDTPVEYGSPSAKFIIKGTVRSNETNAPISNISITVTNTRMYPQPVTVTSDSQGKYVINNLYDYPTDNTYIVQFKDTDGLLNGSFTDSQTTIEFKDPKFTNGDGHWYSGEISKDLDVKLNTKE